jgi:hypothetical protein
MQNLISYKDIFSFDIQTPIAVFEEKPRKELAKECYDLGVIPIVYIKDKTHPLFVRLNNEFKNRGIKQDLKLIILSIEYTKEFLS